MTPWNDALKYFRIVALSFFVYDWACTLPAEIRLYRKQSSIFRMSMACHLLLLTRYLGLAALCLNIGGFFSHEFNDAECGKYYLFMPIIQCFASWASHGVFVVRTSAICNKDPFTTWFLTILAVVVSALELFAQLYSFRRFDAGSSGNCLIQYSDDVNISWLYYLSSSLFDVAVIALTYRGLSLNYDARRSNRAGFSTVLWNSSILYFVTTTFFNILNLAFYARYRTNSSATVLCPLGIALTSMMSARVILNLHDYVNRSSVIELKSTQTPMTESTSQWKSNSIGTPLSAHNAFKSLPRLPEEKEEQQDFVPDYPKLPQDARVLPKWKGPWIGQDKKEDSMV